MKLIFPSDVARIDAYAEEQLGIPRRELMRRAGHAVAEAARAMVGAGAAVCILAGGGNNGGDGYAAACELCSSFAVTVIDVFAAGQRSEEGRYFYDMFSRAGGRILPLPEGAQLPSADLLIDAVFGTGFHGELPLAARLLAEKINAAAARKLAVDIPLGVHAADGSVAEGAVRVDVTVVLSFMKAGLLSYPAAAYVGRVIQDGIGLTAEALAPALTHCGESIDEAYAARHLPVRGENTSKGSFGSLLMITGSEVYRGAAALSLEGALRGGCGYVAYLGTEALISSLCRSFPEAIYRQIPAVSALSEEHCEEIAALSAKNDVTLVGCGCGDSEGLLRLVGRLLAVPGGTLVLDADALNALAHAPTESEMLLKGARRRVVLTPHPGELARLTGRSAAEVQARRMAIASEYAKRTGVLLVLKGARTLLCADEHIYVNMSGSSALSKAGSGDVLAGSLASLIATGGVTEVMCALAVYYHGRAGDALEKMYSSYGVTPSDLPRQIAREMAKTERKRK